MDRFLEILNSVIDTVYVVIMTPGEWLASKAIELAPSLATSLGIHAVESTVLAPLIFTIFSWTIVGLLLRRLRYAVRGLLMTVGAMILRLKYRTLIALHGVRKMFAGDRPGGADGEQQSEGFKLNRLDLIVLDLAERLGPGFALSAPELANRLNLGPGQIQECLEKLSRHSLIDHTTVMTDGYENYRLNETGTYVLTMWERHRARA